MIGSDDMGNWVDNEVLDNNNALQHVEFSILIFHHSVDVQNFVLCEFHVRG